MHYSHSTEPYHEFISAVKRITKVTLQNHIFNMMLLSISKESLPRIVHLNFPSHVQTLNEECEVASKNLIE